MRRFEYRTLELAGAVQKGRICTTVVVVEDGAGPILLGRARALGRTLRDIIRASLFCDRRGAGCRYVRFAELFRF